MASGRKSYSSGSQSDSSEPGTPTAAAIVRPSDPAPVRAQPTELVLDFSLPGQDSRRPLTRRGHVKSRLGCLSCKRRRVKCDEKHPVCGQCSRLKLACAYPPDARRQQSESQDEDAQHRSQDVIQSPRQAISTAQQPQLKPSLGTAMSLDHLAFYHQFLTVAYPSTPIKEYSAWADCAALSHHYDYLAHAVLALGAAHLTANTSADWTTQALHHRMTALRLVNARLGKSVESGPEGDALMGALICLIGGSSLSPDSVPEYLAMARGSWLVAQNVVIPMNRSIFKSITDSRHVDMLMAMFEEQPKDEALFEEYREYTESLAKICTKEYELRYQELLYRTTCLLATNPREAVRSFTTLFILPSLIDHPSFTDFVREDNHTAHLLMSNMFLLDYLLGQACLPKSETPMFQGRKRAVIAWIQRMLGQLPEYLREFADFPLRVCQVLDSYDARYLFWP